MENASKALIIAGAILISIILISIGIMVVNASGALTDQAGTAMDTQAIRTFNEQFSGYEGENQRGSNVKYLLNTVITSNAKNPDDQVTVEMTGSSSGGPSSESSAIDTMRNAIKNSAKYNVTYSTGTQGQVISIKIDPVSASAGGSGGSTTNP